MQDGDTSMMLRGCVLKKNGTIGLFANKGSTVTATTCRLTHNGSSGCEVRDRCTRLLTSNCTLTENGRVGLYVHSAGTMAMARCTVGKNRSLAVLSGGREGADIGGGLVTHCADTKLSGGTKLRHGGRMYTESCELEDEAEAAADAAAAAAAAHAAGTRSPGAGMSSAAAVAGASAGAGAGVLRATQSVKEAGEVDTTVSEDSAGSGADTEAVPADLGAAFSALLDDADADADAAPEAVGVATTATAEAGRSG